MILALVRQKMMQQSSLFAQFNKTHSSLFSNVSTGNRIQLLISCNTAISLQHAIDEKFENSGHTLLANNSAILTCIAGRKQASEVAMQLEVPVIFF
jgi:hypothetical protein